MVIPDLPQRNGKSILLRYYQMKELMVIREMCAICISQSCRPLGHPAQCTERLAPSLQLQNLESIRQIQKYMAVCLILRVVRKYRNTEVKHPRRCTVGQAFEVPGDL